MRFHAFNCCLWAVTACLISTMTQAGLLASPSQPHDVQPTSVAPANSVDLPLPIERSREVAADECRQQVKELLLAQRKGLRGNRDDDDEPGGGGAAADPTKIPPGSPDEAVYNFCKAISDDNTATASDWISDSARGAADQLRDGTLSEEKIADIVKFMTPFNVGGDLKPVATRGDNKANSRQLKRTSTGQVMEFTLKKEKDAYRITEFKVSKAKESKSRY